MTPEQYCAEKAAPVGSSLYYSLLLLPPAKRRMAIALHAFCREARDAVFDTDDLSVAAAKLAWWRQELDRLYAGTPHHPVTRALADVLAEHVLPQSALLAILDGRQMDLEQSRYLDYTILERYCRLLAGTPYALLAEIAGYTQPETPQAIAKLGQAMHLIRLIRTVGADARRGRIYLPIHELQRFNVPAADLLNGRYSLQFTQLMRFQAQRAYEMLATAAQMLPKADKRSQHPYLNMAKLHQTLLDEIAQSDFQVLQQHIRLTPVRKAWITCKTRWNF